MPSPSRQKVHKVQKAHLKGKASCSSCEQLLLSFEIGGVRVRLLRVMIVQRRGSNDFCKIILNSLPRMSSHSLPSRRICVGLN